ncbi:prevent-host-death family protein [Actinomyces sp. oral taxon 171 str. F0337]|nr:prevent-host-death family protein [Actinomyces sp. oral taxon 171 str. F0337]
MALPLTAVLASCGVASRAGKGSSTSSGTSKGGFEVTDIVGRKVTFSAQPKRIVLSESRHIYSLAFLNKTNPIDKVVAWGEDLQKAAPDFYEKILSVAPKAAELPKIGNITKDGLPIETLVSHKPDVFIMTLDAYNSAKEKGYLEKLDGQKITYVVTDFRRDPVKNTVPSVTLMGAVFDKRKEAEAFVSFYKKQVDPIVAKVKSLTSKPATFLWRSPGVNEPGATYSTANLGAIITATGGTNIADSLLSGEEGTLTLEKIIESNPKNIIATGGEWQKQKINEKAQTSYVHLGYKADEASAKASLEQLKNQPGFDQIQAFTDRHVHGIYHQFYDAPYNFIAYLTFAKWQNPEAFSDVDPAKVWKDFHEQYMPWKAEGVFFTSI